MVLITKENKTCKLFSCEPLTVKTLSSYGIQSLTEHPFRRKTERSEQIYNTLRSWFKYSAAPTKHKPPSLHFNKIRFCFISSDAPRTRSHAHAHIHTPTHIANVLFKARNTDNCSIKYWKFCIEKCYRGAVSLYLQAERRAGRNYGQH